LQDQDKNVQIVAAYAMYKLGHKEYLKVFRDAITSEDQTVRANGSLLLGKSGDRSTLTQRSLWWTLQRKDSNDKTRFQAAEALAMLGDEQIYPKLWAMLISAYADDRVMGIRAMGALGTKRAKNAIVTMLDDAVLEVRLAAAEQLGKLGDPLGEKQVREVYTNNLTRGLTGEDLERVRVLTALAIGQIGTEPLKKYLPELLGDASKFVRIAAAKAVLQYAMQG
jgi:HEAT repeat protein